MIYDGFTFFNELDILELRLHILAPHVDQFVLVEATTTHSGLPKPLYYEQNKERFKDFPIIHIVMNDLAIGDSWGAENAQRNGIHRGLPQAQPDDLILISDVDEIPTPDQIRSAAEIGKPCGFCHQLYYYYLNVENKGFNNWVGTRSALRSQFHWPQELRNIHPDMSAGSGGWHWSYLGGTEMIATKIQALAHQENNIPDYTDLNNIKDRVGKFEDLFKREQYYQKVEIDSTYPKYLLDNLDKYRHLILE